MWQLAASYPRVKVAGGPRPTGEEVIRTFPLMESWDPPPPGGVYVTFPGPRGEGELDKCPALKRWGASCRQLGQLHWQLQLDIFALTKGQMFDIIF